MFKISMVADLHHFSETLADNGQAYHLRESSDQKCLKESGAIIDSAFEKIADSDCDLVVIAGDMSNDGEVVCHNEVREKMIKLAEKKKTFVIFSTHDWCCDGHSRRYEGDQIFYDVPTMTAPELREFYKDFGESDAYDTYINEIGAASYAVKLDGVRFIGLNDDKSGTGGAGYCDEHFEWILRQVKDAKANGEVVIIMEHHLVVPNISLLINGGQLIKERIERSEALADAGVDFIIVGHSHMQRTTTYTSENGNSFTQINVGALCGHPSPIVNLTIDEDEFTIDVDHIDKFTYHGVEHTREYTTEHTKDLLLGILKAGMNDKEEFLLRVNSIDQNFNLDGKYYKLISKLVKYLMKMTVGKAGRIINFLTFGKGVNRKAVKQIKKDNLVEHIINIYLSVFDGSAKKYDITDPVYIIVKDVASLPARISKVLPVKALKKEKIQKIFVQIQEIAEELTNPSLPDNQHAVIKRK